MSRVKKLVNQSNQEITLQHPNGSRTILPPGAGIQCVSVMNLEEVRRQASITMDLGEIQEKERGSGRTQLRD